MIRLYPAVPTPHRPPSSQRLNSSQQLKGARDSLRPRGVAVGGQRSRSACSTRRPCGNCNRTTATTAAATTTTRTRCHFRIAGAAGAAAGYSGYPSSALLLLSTVALLSLSPFSCLGSDVPFPAATATAAAPAAAATAAAAIPKPNSLWDTISGDPDYSKLTACLQMADPSVAQLLRAIPSTAAAQPLTLFAPRDSAFEQTAWRGGKSNNTIFEDRCQDEQSATELVSYHVSWTTSSTPYIGQEFPTLLGIQFSPRYYGIPKSLDVPAGSFPIQFVDSANVTATPIVIGGPTAVAAGGIGGGQQEAAAAGGVQVPAPSYLFPVDRVLRVPVGTIWQTLSLDPSFSLLVAALNATSLPETLDSKGGTASYTIFAPDNDAIRATPDFPGDDPAALEVLLSFHTLDFGVYPMSLTGAHFSQQLFKVDPSLGSLSRDYYRQFYAENFEDGHVTSLAGPLLNVSRASSSSLSRSSCLASLQQQQQQPQQQPQPQQEDGSLQPPDRLLPSSSDPLLLIDGVPISEADITATNGIIHRLSSAVMAPPNTVAGVLVDPPFPLSAAGALTAGGGEDRGGGDGDGSGFEALGELVRLAWPLVNATLMEEGPLTFLAPTDTAFDVAIAAGDLPPRPWYNASSPHSYPSDLTPEGAARVLLSHTLRTPKSQGPLLFSPAAADPFASGFRDGDRFSTAVASGASGGETGPKRGASEAEVKVGVRVLEMGTRSAVAGVVGGVADREVYVDGARVIQCVDGAGVGHDCGSNPRPSNTYALNGAHLCVVHAVDRVIFPADAEMDLAAILQDIPSLSRFLALLREHGLLPLSSSSWSKPNPATIGGGNLEDAVEGGGVGEGKGGSPVLHNDDKRNNIKLEKQQRGFTTVFAPTNDALDLLEKQRPWLFQNATEAASAAAAVATAAATVGGSSRGGESGGGEGVGEEIGGGRRGAGGGDGGEWSPIRELLAYHLVPDAALFSRYLNASSPPTRTLALDGTAPVAASFVITPPGGTATNAGLSFSSPAGGGVGVVPGAPTAAGAGSNTGAIGGAVSGKGSATEVEQREKGNWGAVSVGSEGTGILHVNLQSCSLTDRSASDGVLHVLSFVGGNSTHRDGDSTYGFDDAGAGADSSTGVLVPDVLELAYAHGFRETYRAIINAGAEVNADASAAAGVDGKVVASSISVAKALRGRAAHTLLAVADKDNTPREKTPKDEEVSLSPALSPSELDSESLASGNRLRYQTLVGDQTFGPGPGATASISNSGNSGGGGSSVIDSVAFKTLLSGAEVHLFNNSENPGNPFFSPTTNGSSSGLNLNQAEVLLIDEGMVALNGRIHQISEALHPPAPDVFSLLSSHSRLSGWADWVELAGLAELLSDPEAGPFTVFAPVDSSLDLVPGLMKVAADKKSLEKLVRFHTAMGTLSTTTTEPVAARTAITTSTRTASRLFTPSLANATAEQRSVLSGGRFASGRRLWTLLDSDGEHDGRTAVTLSVQISAAATGALNGARGYAARRRRSGTGSSGGSCYGVRVFLGPGGGQQQQVGGVYLFLGAFAAEVVLPDLNAVNGVVHGISSVMTYPGYKRPRPE